MGDKCCRVCGETKAAEDFPPQRRKCKACMSATTRAWQLANPEKAKDLALRNNFRRRARRAADEEVQWSVLLERYGGKCAICESTHRLTIDHVVSVTKGGTHTYDNCQVLCLRCNLQKAHRDGTSNRPKQSA